MKYKNMIWDGFQEISDFTAKWNLKRNCLKELIDLVMQEYNAGANDLLEYLEEKGKRKTNKTLSYEKGQL